ncbi:MAG TPA: hypothetical protein VMQ11_02760, partial [Alphaproteobacteria bacterium]|nr:hypothetical protein [Alphaproteobacteria bacterium]
PGGVTTADALAAANDACRSETGFEGAVTPTADDCTGGLLDPDDWNAGPMRQKIVYYKRGTLHSDDIAAPLGVASSTFALGPGGVAPIGTRTFCQGTCTPPQPATQATPFPWTWLPLHNP